MKINKYGFYALIAVPTLLVFLSSCAPFRPSETTVATPPTEHDRGQSRKKFRSLAIAFCANTVFSDPAKLGELAAEKCGDLKGKLKLVGQDWGMDCPLFTQNRVTYMCEKIPVKPGAKRSDMSGSR